jgi:hypothetical protein
VTQLSLDDAVDRPNPNAHLFDADGKPRRLLWCSDSARLGGPCPYDDPARARFAPAGPCCKTIPGALEHQAAVASRVAENRRKLGAP